MNQTRISRTILLSRKFHIFFIFVTILFNYNVCPWIYLNLNTIYSIIFLLFIIRLNVYPILIVSWISINNYSIIRLISRIISFEVLIFLIFFIIIIITEDFKFVNIIFYQLNLKFFILIYPLYFIFIITVFLFNPPDSNENFPPTHDTEWK